MGDMAAKRHPHHGRIFACQVSVAVGIPFSLLILKVRESHHGQAVVKGNLKGMHMIRYITTISREIGVGSTFECNEADRS